MKLLVSAKLSAFLHRSKKAGLLVGGVLLLALLLAAAIIVQPRWMAGLPFSHAVDTSVAQAESAPDMVEVRRGTIKKSLLLDGELRAVRSRTVYANTSEEAKIVYLPLEGSSVKAGDRLVELDSTTVLTKVKDIEERIIAAENDIVKIKSQQESALQEMEVRLSQLWLAYEQAKLKARVPADVVPRREYQDRQLALEKAKEEYENQLGKIEQKKKEQQAELQVKTIDKDKLQVQLDQAKDNLDGMNIKAPSDGMVIYSDHWDWSERRKIQVGDVVWGGFSLVRLPDLQEMEIVAQVNEVDGPKLSIGQRAKAVLDSHPDVEITGSVKDISQTAVKAGWMAKTNVFRVAVSLDKTVTDIMKPGMSAQVAVAIAEFPSLLLVPRSAVRFEGDAPTVVRLEGEKHQRPVAVTVLASDSVHYALADKGALKEGDRVLGK
jgi:multidrug efflux pump subunit AcrA (membrane-fusion protein)